MMRVAYSQCGVLLADWLDYLLSLCMPYFLLRDVEFKLIRLPSFCDPERIVFYIQGHHWIFAVHEFVVVKLRIYLETRTLF